ncbi:GD24513 [Drosophila simulans]|uniref:GD24513 n=1 Tax=Drosophila simulans TaxID=7240 RepID=B4NUF4_DROSI|nr:GD24513 [Drosophila simulans]
MRYDDDKKSEQHRLGRSSHEQEQKQDWDDIEDDDEDQDEDEDEELGPDRCLSGGRDGQRLSALSSRGKKAEPK